MEPLSSSQVTQGITYLIRSNHLDINREEYDLLVLLKIFHFYEITEDQQDDLFIIIKKFEDAQDQSHERVMMGFQDYPALTFADLVREKQKLFELINQANLCDLNLSIIDYLNFNYRDGEVLDEFDKQKLDYLNNFIKINIIKIYLNFMNYLEIVEYSDFVLFHKMVLLQIKNVSYEEATIVMCPLNVQILINKKKINHEYLNIIKKKIKGFISNNTLEIQGPNERSLF